MRQTEAAQRARPLPNLAAPAAPHPGVPRCDFLPLGTVTTVACGIDNMGSAAMTAPMAFHADHPDAPHSPAAAPGGGDRTLAAERAPRRNGSHTPAGRNGNEPVASGSGPGRSGTPVSATGRGAPCPHAAGTRACAGPAAIGAMAVAGHGASGGGGRRRTGWARHGAQGA